MLDSVVRGGETIELRAQGVGVELAASPGHCMRSERHPRLVDGDDRVLGRSRDKV